MSCVACGNENVAATCKKSLAVPQSETEIPYNLTFKNVSTQKHVNGYS